MSGIPTLNTTTDNARASGGYQEWATAGFLAVSIMITKVAIWLRRICVMTVLHVFTRSTLELVPFFLFRLECGT